MISKASGTAARKVTPSNRWTITYLKRTDAGCDGGGSGTTFVSKRDTYINEKSDKQDENKGDDDEIKS